MSGLAENQPIHRKTRLQVWQSLLLAAERQHRHASLHRCAVLDRVDPIRDQITLAWFALPDRSIKQLGPNIASALVIAAAVFRGPDSTQCSSGWRGPCSDESSPPVAPVQLGSKVDSSGRQHGSTGGNPLNALQGSEPAAKQCDERSRRYGPRAKARRIGHTGQLQSLRAGVGGEAPQEKEARGGESRREGTGLGGREGCIGVSQHKDGRVRACGNERGAARGAGDVGNLQERTIRSKNTEQSVQGRSARCDTVRSVGRLWHSADRPRGLHLTRRGNAPGGRLAVIRPNARQPIPTPFSERGRRRLVTNLAGFVLAFAG